MAKDRSKGKERNRKGKAQSTEDIKARRKARNQAAAAAPKKEKRSLREYFKGVKLEMKKVVWPTKKELGSYTVVVLVACAFFALAFFVIDTGFLAVLERLLGISM
jgi:preprotein translocase subunit SecE